MKFLKNIKNRLSRSVKDESGVTLVEVVITTALSLAMVGLAGYAVYSATLTNNVSIANADNAITSSGINSQMKSAADNAVALRVHGTNRLDAKMSDGRCLAWRLDSNELQVFKSSSSISSEEGWATLNDEVSGFTVELKPNSLSYSYSKDGKSQSNTFPLALSKADSAPCW